VAASQNLIGCVQIEKMEASWRYFAHNPLLWAKLQVASSQHRNQRSAIRLPTPGNYLQIEKPEIR